MTRSLSKYTLGASFASLACVLALGVATASAATPSGEFAVFKECPTSNPGVTKCIYSQTTSGEVKIGSTSVPIKKTITLQGGLEGESETLVGAANGETLSKTPQAVPGGLLGLVKCEEFSGLVKKACEATFQNGVTGVNATTELVGTVLVNEAHLAEAEGVALVLPVRIHLENPFLGSECYIGSASKPVTLHLTTGTTSPPPPNKPITGSTGETEFREEGRIIVINGNELVDNSFSVPTASGCGPLPLSEYVVDPVIDAKLGLPSASGKNTARLKGTIYQASAKAVIAHE